MTHSSPIVAAFRGGIALAPKNQGLSNPIISLPLPPSLVYYADDSLVSEGDAVLAGETIASNQVSSTSGLVKQITQTGGSRFAIHIAPDGLNKLADNFDDTLPALEQIRLAGINGLGGAAFSSYEKLRSQKRQPLSTLIINAAECEPLISCDEALMLEHAAETVLGIDVLMSITQAKQCIVAIEDNKPRAIKAISHAIDQHDKANLHIKIMPTRYPGGAETVLLRQLTGATITKDQLPAEHDVLCFNIATAYNVHLAVNKQPFFGRITSIAGDKAMSPCNVRAVFGTPLSFILEQTGNPVRPDTNIKIGGPLSGQSVADHQEVIALSLDAKCNAIILEARQAPTNEQACIRCGDCADICPESLLPQQLFRYRHDQGKLAEYHLQRCIECRCCDLVCPSSIKLTDYFNTSKQQQRALQQANEAAKLAEARFAAREKRLARNALIREQQLIEEKRKAAEKTKPAAMDIKAALARAKKKQSKPTSSGGAE